MDVPADFHQMAIDDVETLILRVIPDLYPMLVWPQELGFPKTIFEAPENKNVASSISINVPGITHVMRVGANLEFVVDSKKLVFADVGAGNWDIYKNLRIHVGADKKPATSVGELYAFMHRAYHGTIEILLMQMRM